MNKNKSSVISAIIIFTILIPLFSYSNNLITYASPTLNVTVKTNKNTYYTQENVLISGNLAADGQPVSGDLVGLQICKPSETTIVLRTVPTGTLSNENWKISILEITPADANDNPKNVFKPCSWAYFDVKIKSNENHTISVLTGINIYDSKSISLGVYTSSAPIIPGATATYRIQSWIPAWAHTGSAFAYVTVYSDWPKNHGYPLCPEKNVTFILSNYLTDPVSKSLRASTLSTTYSANQNPGEYSSSFRIYDVPEPQIGTYTVYATSYHAGELAYNDTQFSVESAAFPPQASFYYLPPEPYVNMTVTFDASLSTPEGGTITSYTWNFGDGTPEVTETDPTTTHTFTNSGRYIVTLNVTDSEGLWSTTSKPIDILPPTGPTANFSYSPGSPWVNGTTLFDASSSIPGWNGTGYAPIVNYTWNFGDGNITTTHTATITHVYTAEGNYTVTLTITDANNLSNSTSKIVKVSLTPGLIGDLNGDGVVDIYDLVIVAAAYGSSPGDHNWDARADTNNDSVIDIFDLVTVASHFGETTG